MNPATIKEARELFDNIYQGVKDLSTEVIICPPSIYYLPNLEFKALNLYLGAQNCFWEQAGAYTGEISPKMLKNIGCKYVILGHSERRQYLGETDEIVGKKLKAVLEAGLIPILCVGDKSRESKQDIRGVELQIESALRGINNSELKNMLVVYEPVWAISGQGGKPAGLKETEEAMAFIKKVLKEKFNLELKILYGGSVNAGNAKDYIDAGFDGLLVGAASLNAQEFIKIAKQYE